MAGSMNIKKISKSQKLFRLSLGILILAVLLLAWLKVVNLYKNVELNHLNVKISEKQVQIEQEESSEWYKKFLAVKALEDWDTNMSRYDRIEKISEILEDLKNIWDWEGDTTIELSDFNVSLEEISLKWVVSSLRDLYYTNVSWKMKAVLDRFESLEFIDKMVIKEYNKVDNWFEFSLYANVINNGGE